MRNELNRMANNIQDPEAKRIFGAEMEDFFLLFNRYLTEKAKGEKMYVLLSKFGFEIEKMRVSFWVVACRLLIQPSGLVLKLNLILVLVLVIVIYLKNLQFQPIANGTK